MIMMLYAGIAILVIGVMMVIGGAISYVITLDRIQQQQCGENKVVRETVSPNGIHTTVFYPPCGDPTQGVIEFIAGLLALAGGVVIIVKSRRTVVPKV